jgi:hypothetical protein
MVNLSIVWLITVSNFISSGLAIAKSFDASSPVAKRHQMSWRAGLDLSQVAIGGIKYGMSEPEVLRKLGHPRTRATKMNCLGAIDQLHYPGLIIDLEQKGKQKYVTFINATDSHYATERGVKVGDSINRVITAYQPVAQLSPDRTVTINDRQYYDIFLVFKSNNQRKITSISIFFEC